jgi:hypothetical protein
MSKSPEQGQVRLSANVFKETWLPDAGTCISLAAGWKTLSSWVVPACKRGWIDSIATAFRFPARCPRVRRGWIGGLECDRGGGKGYPRVRGGGSLTIRLYPGPEAELSSCTRGSEQAGQQNPALSLPAADWETAAGRWQGISLAWLPATSRRKR